MRAVSSIEGRIRRHLRSLEPYVPITPLEVLAQEGGIPPEKIIKLDGNENPYGCSPRVSQALARYPYFHIYPDPEQRELRQALSRYVGLPPEFIVLGAGSDELIDLVLRLFLERGDKVINCVPTFGMYPFSTAVCGGEVVSVPRDEGFAVDGAAVKQAIDRRTKVLFLASPNNPSANIAPLSQVQELLDTGLLVVVDEAYYEFSGITVAPWVAQHENLIVLRTFSKWAGLAGLRIGYGLLPPRLASFIMHIKPPYNINTAAQVAVRESLADLANLQGAVQAIVAERERLFRRLQDIPALKPYPSQANFILCRLLRGEARPVHQALARQGIFVRYLDNPRLRDCLRFSVGRPEHTDALIEALRKLC